MQCKAMQCKHWHWQINISLDPSNVKLVSGKCEPMYSIEIKSDQTDPLCMHQFSNHLNDSI